MTLISGLFYSDNADTIGFDLASVNLDPIRIEFNPDCSASADTTLIERGKTI